MSATKKSYQVITTGAVLTALLFSIKAQADVGQDYSPTKEFSEQITFTVDGEAKPACIAPQTALLVAKRVPNQNTQLVLPKDSPYQSATVLKRDSLDPKLAVRQYEDRLVTKEGDAITLKGSIDNQQNTNGGTWQDSHGCQGQFVVQQRP